MAAESDPRRRDQRGETLLESLIAIIILSLIATAGYTALSTSTRVSASRANTAEAETLLRDAVEELQSPDTAYVDRAACPGAVSYSFPDVSLPLGYTVAADSVSFWTGASTTPATAVSATFTSACPATSADDDGLQLVEVTVTEPLGNQHTLTAAKRRP